MTTMTKHRNDAMAEALRAAGVREARTPYGTVTLEHGRLRISGTRAQVRTWAAMSGEDVLDGPHGAVLSDAGEIVDATPTGWATDRWAHDVLVDAVVHRGDGWLVGYIAARAAEHARPAANGNGDGRDATVRERVREALVVRGDWMSVRDVCEAAPDLNPKSVGSVLWAEARDGGVERRKLEDGGVRYRLTA